MSEQLEGKTVAILVADGFEQIEFTDPKKALEEAGATVKVVSPEKGKVQGFNHFDMADTFGVDVPLDRAKADDFDALVLPGGAWNPDKLRTMDAALDFVKAFDSAGKPIAAICHAPWILAEAKIADGRKLTSYHSIQTDLKNAGANWVDESCVVDGNLTTSRNPNDLPHFCQTIVEQFSGAGVKG